MFPGDFLPLLGASLPPLFGSLPGGADLAWTFLVRLVPAAGVAGLVGWDAGFRSDNPRAWPTAAVLVGVASTAALVVLAALYLVAGRDHQVPDPAGGDGNGRREE
ncbi:hypothetical protein [Halobaculum magnesiiphilum]|uniref:Uncharacterized protein n=1 Tax=Halobaculum magnesiiphilum TaxID=1017351 RepID=A0A8T8WC53_9EURY|nr:hypothetical protein [Halobaculum magnesiiphilum]QZP37437.1 hypothetical protein K6T50_14350 [Halobaculum magnesiiphilum]